MDMETEAQVLPTYNRKEKSLGLLCENFLSLYGAEEEAECISLDEAASRLGVERRRIYDIVNILESVEVLVRKAKNCYMWYGFTRLPQALKQMKQAALREYGLQGFGSLPHGSADEENIQDDSTFGTQESVNGPGSCEDPYNPFKPKSKADCRREKSLGLLSQKFVQLFLISQSKVVSLDEAAKILFGGCTDASKLKTKVRRLYDIANVLTSLQLIEKTHGAENRKPAFKWLGVKENGFPFRKRQFGTSRPNSADASVPAKRPAIKRGAPSIEQTGKRYSYKPLQPKCGNFGGSPPPPAFSHAAADGLSAYDASVHGGLPFSMHFGPGSGWMDWSRGLATDCRCFGSGGAGCSSVDGGSIAIPWAAGHPCSTLPPNAECTCSFKAMHDRSVCVTPNSAAPDVRCPAHPSQLGGIAAAMQYQNETLNNMFAHYVDYWQNICQRTFDPSPVAPPAPKHESTCSK